MSCRSATVGADMKTHKDIEVPTELAALLAVDSEARRVFERMRPSCQREYVVWVSAAETEATRARRLAGVLNRIRDYGARHGLFGGTERT
jgi:uncharacterized protein YdeI (YjbR/CyaY-like superfamily)